MARAKRSVRIRAVTRRAAEPMPANDATPERLARADGHSAVVEAKIDRGTDRQARARRFADAPIDRMRKAGHVTLAQWHAGNWYREQYELSGLPGVKAQNLNRTGAGECGYGMPMTEMQARARRNVRIARSIMDALMLRLIDAALIEESLPVFLNGRQRRRYTERLGRALDPLAAWLGA